MNTNPPSTTPLPFRKPKKSRQTSAWTGAILTGIVLATLFTMFTKPASLFSGEMGDKFAAAMTAQANGNTINALQGTAVPDAAVRIGIVAGHWGNDSGTVCPDGTTEADVNLAIAKMVQTKLSGMGFQVDILKEFDPRLEGYTAALLVSIHNDSCEYVNEEATGYKVAAAVGARDMNLASRLSGCLTARYGATTGMTFHPGSITTDMTEYHAFGEINPGTPATIIETGFLNKDFEILTQHQDMVAQGVTNGILCFINNESVDSTPTPRTNSFKPLMNCC